MTSGLPRDPTAVPVRRLAAAAIDLAVFAAAAWLVFISMATTIGGDLGDAGCTAYQDRVGGLTLCAGFSGELHVVRGGAAIGFLLVLLGIWVADHVVLQGFLGATPGKLLLGLRVVDAAGMPARPGSMALRTLPLLVGWAAFGFGFAVAALIGAVMILGSVTHQRVGDRLARTFVVRTGDVGSPPDPRAAAPA